jgi:hypothetical protein
MTRNGKLMGAAGLVLGLVAGIGVAWASIPATNGSITGCINPTTGALRVVDAAAGQTCSSFERSVTWNQEGQPGATGATGPIGPQGPAGPVGPQGPAGPVAPDPVLVSTVFPRASGAPSGNLAAGEIPGCQFTAGVGTICGRLDVGSLSLPPGTWEVTAQLLTDVSARTVFDPSRFIRCDESRSSSDKIEIKMDDNEENYRQSWTWIVSNTGQSNLTWSLGCVVDRPLFSSVADKTWAYVNYAVLIARPVGTVTSG